MLAMPFITGTQHLVEPTQLARALLQSPRSLLPAIALPTLMLRPVIGAPIGDINCFIMRVITAWAMRTWRHPTKSRVLPHSQAITLKPAANVDNARHADSHPHPRVWAPSGASIWGFAGAG